MSIISFAVKKTPPPCNVIWEGQTQIHEERVFGHGESSYYYIGQAYYDPGDDIDICKLSFALSQMDTTDISGKTYYAEIWTTTGTGASIVLDTKQGSTSDGVSGNNSWDETWVDFNFSSFISLTNGVRYALLVYVDIPDIDDYTYAHVSNIDDLSGFAAIFTAAGARYWYQASGFDATIKIYV